MLIMLVLFDAITVLAGCLLGFSFKNLLDIVFDDNDHTGRC